MTTILRLETPQCSLREAKCSHWGDLTRHQDVLRELYEERNLSLAAVIDMLRTQHGVILSVPMSKKKLRQWNINKANIGLKSSQDAHRGKVSIKRGTDPRFMIRGFREYRVVPIPKQASSLPRALQPPDALNFQESLFRAVCTHVGQKLQPRLRVKEGAVLTTGYGIKPPVSLRARVPAPPEMGEFGLSICSALDNRKNMTPISFSASLEQGFRLVKDVLQNDHFGLPLTVLFITANSRAASIPNIGRVFLQHFGRMAFLVYGPQHPYVTFASNLLRLFDVTGVLEDVAKAVADTYEHTLGMEDPYTLRGKGMYLDISFALREGRHSPSEFGQKSVQLVDSIRKLDPTPEMLYAQRDITHACAWNLMDIGEFSTAENLLDSIQADFKMVLDGEVPDILDSEDICRSMGALARAWSGLGHHEKAREAWTEIIQCLSIISDYTSPVLMEIISYFGKHLASLNLDAEAMKLYAIVDERLTQYARQNGIENTFSIIAESSNSEIPSSQEKEKEPGKHETG